MIHNQILMNREAPARILKPYLPLRNQERGISEPLLRDALASNISTLSSRIRKLRKNCDRSQLEQSKLPKYGLATPGERKFLEIKDVYSLIQKQCELLANRYNQNHFNDSKHFNNRLKTLKSKIDAVLVILDVPERERDVHQLIYWYNHIFFDPINIETLSRSIEDLTARFKRCFETPTFFDSVRDANTKHSQIDPARIRYVAIHISTMERIFNELFELVSPVGSCLVLKDLNDEDYCELFKGFKPILSLDIIFRSIKSSFHDGKKIKVYTGEQKRLFAETMYFLDRDRKKDDLKVKVNLDTYKPEELGLE